MVMSEVHPPVSSKAPCPCGSGKKYKRCCGPRDAEVLREKRQHSVWKWVLAGGVFAAAIIAGLTVVVRTASAPELLPPPPPRPPSQPSSAGATPAPWTYNPATNKHWHPEHQHWHDGLPPNQGQAPPAHSATAPPAIPNPEPWQYDAASNKHFDPNHNHWHEGPPPAQGGTPPPVSPVPEANDGADTAPAEAAPSEAASEDGEVSADSAPTESDAAP
jgi:hypothetical protein